MSVPDLFSAGFAWGDEGVAAVATPVTTARSAAFTPADRTNRNPRKASVATVADYRDNAPVSQNAVGADATDHATPKSAVFCGVQPSVALPVACVATVANWLEGIEAMRVARPGPVMWHGKWKTVTRDALAFVRLWGSDAIAAGWSTLDVFGTNPDPRHRRVDRLGLVVMLDGRPIQSIERDSALIGTHPGMTKFNRGLRTDGAIAVWDLLALGRPAGGRGLGERADALPLSTPPCQQA